MLELLFLLLPFAAGYGFVMGKQSANQKERDSSKKAFEKYSAGLNFLLEDKEQQAVEAFISALEVNSNNLETHLTLARLFRKQGKIENAIKIHEHLAMQALDEESHRKVCIELSENYIACGRLKRAEDVLGEVDDIHNPDIIFHRLLVFQQTKDWNSSITEYPKATGHEKCDHLLAAHCCQAAMVQQDESIKKKLLKQSFNYQKDFITALVMLAEYHMQRSNYGTAINLLTKALDKQPRLAPMLLNQLASCYQDTNRVTELANYIQPHLKSPENLAFALKYCELLEQTDNHEDALELIVTVLKNRVSISAFVHLLRLHRANIRDVDAKKRFEQVESLVEQYLNTQPAFECSSCGYHPSFHSWQCPSCGQWETVFPNRMLSS